MSTQLALFPELHSESEEIKRSLDKLRKSLFARINELEKMVLLLERRMDTISGLELAPPPEKKDAQKC